MSLSIALARLSSLGDVLLVTPLLRQIRTHYPDARLDMIVDERFAECICHNPHINNVYTYSRSARTLTPQPLGNFRYDIAVDLQRNNRSSEIMRGIQHMHRATLNKHRWQKLKIVYLKQGFDRPTIPIAERYRQAAQLRGVLSVPDDGQGLELWLPEEAVSQMYAPHRREVISRELSKESSREPSEHANQQQSTVQQFRIAIAPGAHHATKRWLPERFAEAAIELVCVHARGHTGAISAEILLLGGSMDKQLCDEIATMIRRHNPQVQVRNYSGATSLYDTARSLDTAALLLTNDTGVMHIAAARRVPVVAVFGSTVQEFGFAPFRVPHEIVQASREQVPCRPCTHIGRASCPKRHFRCMNAVTVETVVQAAQKLLISTTTVAKV